MGKEITNNQAKLEKNESRSLWRSKIRRNPSLKILLARFPAIKHLRECVIALLIFPLLIPCYIGYLSTSSGDLLFHALWWAPSWQNWSWTLQVEVFTVFPAISFYIASLIVLDKRARENKPIQSSIFTVPFSVGIAEFMMGLMCTCGFPFPFGIYSASYAAGAISIIGFRFLVKYRLGPWLVPPEVLTATEPAGLSSQSMRNQKELEETSAGKNHLIAFLEYELATGQVVGVKDVIRSLKVELDEAKALLDALNEPASYSEEDVPGLKALATTVLQQFTEPTLLDVLRMPGCSSVKAAKALGKYLVDEGIIERFPRHSGKVASPVTLAQKPITAGPATTHTCVVCKGTIAGINYECPGCGARHHIGCAAALKASQGGCFACNRAIGQLPAIDEAAPSIIGIEEISRELDEILVVDEIMHKNITPLLDKVGQDLGRYVEASGMVVSLGDAVETTTAKLSKLVSATRAAAEQDRGAIMSEINELKAEMFRQFKEMREGNLDDNAIMEILRESKGNAKLLGRRVGRSIERMQARGLDEAAIQRDTERIFHVLGRLQALKEYMKQSPREMVVSMILGGITEALPGMVVKTVGYWLTDKFIERFL